MAIDYKKEWEKLHNSHGKCLLDKRKILHGPNPLLSTIMDTQIERTIDDREKLMQEYMKENMLTEIDGADKHYHHVKIVSARKKRGPIGTMYIHKKDFEAWCKRETNECMQKFGVKILTGADLNIICTKCGLRLGLHSGTKCPTEGGK